MSTADCIAAWAMIGTWVSGLATIGALFFAGSALSTWKEQEKLKVKLDFKRSIHDYFSVLAKLPNNLQQNDYTLKAVELAELLNAFKTCNNCWSMTEGMLEKTNIEEHWIDFLEMHLGYLKKNNDAFQVSLPLTFILAEKFVFTK